VLIDPAGAGLYGVFSCRCKFRQVAVPYRRFRPPSGVGRNWLSSGLLGFVEGVLPVKPALRVTHRGNQISERSVLAFRWSRFASPIRKSRWMGVSCGGSDRWSVPPSLQTGTSDHFGPPLEEVLVRVGSIVQQDALTGPTADIISRRASPLPPSWREPCRSCMTMASSPGSLARRADRAARIPSGVTQSSPSPFCKQCCDSQSPIAIRPRRIGHFAQRHRQARITRFFARCLSADARTRHHARRATRAHIGKSWRVSSSGGVIR